MDIHDACDFIILKMQEAGENLSNLKLQKLLYYTQAWHLAFEKKPLFDTGFQAWIHGPVSKEIFERFKSEKSLYSEIEMDDIRADFDINSLLEEDKTHISNVLDVYAQFSGIQLEEMTHNEMPWINARKGVNATVRCENEICNDDMMRFYSARMQ